MGMRPVTISTSDASGGAVASDVVPVNWRAHDFNIGAQANATGTVDFDLQYTLDDIRAEGWDPATANWSPWPAPFDGATGDVGGSMTIPCTAVRLLQNSGNGSVSVRLVFAGE